MIEIIKETKQMTIDQINTMELDNNLNNVIIFYRSQNEKDGVPVFLKKMKERGYGFASPIFDRSVVYRGNTIKEAIKSAQQGRTVYFLKQEDSDQLFKVQKK